MALIDLTHQITYTRHRAWFRVLRALVTWLCYYQSATPEHIEGKIFQYKYERGATMFNPDYSDMSLMRNIDGSPIISSSPSIL